MDDESKETPTLVPSEIIEFPPAKEVVPVMVRPGYCECGCGETVRIGIRFRPGHNLRLDQVNGMPRGMIPYPKGGPSSSRGRKRRPITQAYRHVMNSKYPGDPQGRTGAEILALAMFKQAIEQGDVAAAKEITDRVEGKAPEVLEVDGDVNVNVTIYDRIEQLVSKLRGTPMAAQAPPVDEVRDRPALPGGSGELPDPSGGGVHPETNG